jgi:hypothetical protein
MSVRRHLGLDGSQDADGQAGGVLAEARRRWPVWCSADPVLGVVVDVVELPGWLRGADPAAADEVLAALAWWSAPSGGDDVAATGVLAWLLVPAACRIAARLQGMSPRIDEVVASELWLQARTVGQVPGRRRVAANIALNTRREVVTRLGRGGGATWARTCVVDPTSATWRDLDALDEGSPAVDRAAGADGVGAFLGRAVWSSVITEADRDLLLAAAAAAGELRIPLGAGGGMTTPTVAQVIGPQFGLSARVARRRTGRALGALREIAAAGTLGSAHLGEKVPA